jgi:sec-independent protein translocase protein TatC
MASAIRTIGHEDRLSLVDHLDELLTRLLICAAALVVAFGLCLWQNNTLIQWITEPLSKQTQRQVVRGEGPLGQTALAQQAVLGLARETEALARTLSAPASGLPAATRAQLAAQIPGVQAAVAKVPKVPQGNKTVTLGIAEPFTVTLTISLYFALVLSLPVILWELYGFVLPAFRPTERRTVLPLLSAIPLLFVVGVLFGYFIVLPAAVRFFENFNSSQFDVLVQASQYYRFAATTLLAMGLIFQVPVAILALVRVGVVTPTQLRKGRRYAIVVCAAIAALLPGDVTVMLLETIPLYVLYEASILLAALMMRRASKREEAMATATATAAAAGSVSAAGTGAAGGTGRVGAAGISIKSAGQSVQSSIDTTEQSVQTIIDHTDPELSE